MLYIIEGVLGTIVGRSSSTEDVESTVLAQMKLSDAALTKLRNKLQRAKSGRVNVDFGGVGCTILVIDESTDK